MFFAQFLIRSKVCFLNLTSAKCTQPKSFAPADHQFIRQPHPSRWRAPAPTYPGLPGEDSGGEVLKQVTHISV